MTTLLRSTRIVSKGTSESGRQYNLIFAAMNLPAFPAKLRRIAVQVVNVLSTRGFFSSLPGNKRSECR